MHTWSMGVIFRHLQQWSNSYFPFRWLGTTSQEKWRITDPVTRALAVCIMWQPSPVDLENPILSIKHTITDRWRHSPLSDIWWHTQKHRRLPLNISKLFLTVRATEHWHRLPTEVVCLHSWKLSNLDWTWSWATFCRWPCMSRVVGLNNYQMHLPASTIPWICDLPLIQAIFFSPLEIS